jgi:hypothetical protein
LNSNRSGMELWDMHSLFVFCFLTQVMVQELARNSKGRKWR